MEDNSPTDQEVANNTENLQIPDCAVNLLGSVDQIAARRQAVLRRWSEFKDVAAQRRSKLQDIKKLQQFNRNCEELEGWIANRMKIASDESHKDATNMQAKIKKHKTFEAEIHANENALSAMKVSGHELINQGHFATDAIAAKLEYLEEQWKLLLEQNTDKMRKLQDAQAYLTFKREADEVESWIHSKSETARSNEIGKDLEHVIMLQKKFDDFTSDLGASDARIDAVNKIALDLIREGHPESAAIQSRQQAINEAWSTLKKLAAHRHELLSNAKQIHAFNRDADEIGGRISEKAAMLATDDYGKDVASVEALQRKHEVFSRDLAALDGSVSALSDDAKRLCMSFPEYTEDVQQKQSTISWQWDELSNATRQRKEKLEDAHHLQHFLNDLQSSLSWIADMKALMSADETARDVAGADALLHRHQERVDEVQARQTNFNAVDELGNRLIQRGHFASEELKQKLAALQLARNDLDDLLQRRKHDFQEAHAMHVFMRDAEQIESWLGSRESALRTDDIGDSLDTVEALLKKHDDFEKSLAAHEEKEFALKQSAQQLATQGHAQIAQIQSRCEAVLQRRSELEKSAHARREKLEASKQLQEFKRDADEVEVWMKEKLQVAVDSSYQDPTNLRGKIKNHEAFMSEIQANQSRLAAVKESGSALVSAGHYGNEYLQSRIKQLDQGWDKLQSEAKMKERRLLEAHEYQEFNRKVDDVESWCKDIEKSLASEDLGRDLGTVKNLIKKHQLLEADVAGHLERLEAIQKHAQEMVKNGNFQSAAIQLRQDTLTKHYQGFSQPMQRRKQKLEESLQLQEFLRTIDDEDSWIKEKEPLAQSTNFGSSLSGVQTLVKKHNALLAELTGRNSHFQSAEKAAQDLIASGHFAADHVRQRRDNLLQSWKSLNNAAEKRASALDHRLKVQQYLSEVNESQAWMAEKEPIVNNDNYGKDEDSAQVLLKKHEIVEQDLRTYQSTVDHLSQDCLKCCINNKAKQQIVTIAHTFEAGDDKRKLSVGKDETVTLVSKDSDDWWRCEKDGQVGFVPASYIRERYSLSSDQANNASATSFQSTPTDVDSTVITTVQERQQALEKQYKQLMVAAAYRRKRLEETQQLFQFTRELDEIEAWMNTREAIASQEDVGTDLEHNKTLEKKFDEFMNDIAANSSRIQVANSLADTLVKGGHTDKEIIENRRTSLNERWNALQGLSQSRRNTLEAAQQIHRFNRNVDDTKARFNEKDTVLSSDDYGKDVYSVQELQRKHDAAVRDLLALESKVQDLRKEADRLSSEQPTKSTEVHQKLEEIDIGWQALQDKASSREAALTESLAYQQFLSNYWELSSWSAGVLSIAQATELADDISGAENLLKRHQDLQFEIDARQDDFVRLHSFGNDLISKRHSRGTEIQERLETLTASTKELTATMTKRKQELEQCVELQMFKRMADQVEAWIATRGSPLESEDVGSTLDAVEAMLKKHTEFENSLTAQREKIHSVTAEADRLIAQKHYDALAISDRKHAVLAHWELLLENSSNRQKRLNQALKVQQFYRDADEADAWMTERRQIAIDPSYRDPNNLQEKSQKHQTFFAEITANEARIFSLIDMGRRLMTESPDCAVPISERISELERAWKELCQHSEEKTCKLKDAENLQQFYVGLEDVDFWLAEVELQLASQDLGKDLPAVQSLLKKHEFLETDITAHQGRIEEVNQQARAFVEANHFDAESITARQKHILQRYTNVQSSAEERRKILEASLQLQSLLRDLDDLDAWIKERLRIASSEDFGRDLTGVQNLQKKHDVFDGELNSFEPKVDGVLDTASTLISADHFAAEDIAIRKEQLRQDWERLLSQSKARTMKLQEALEYQQLRASIDEEESWITEKLTMMTSVDSIETVAGAQALMKKHDAFELDLSAHQGHVQERVKVGKALIDRQNYQASSIKECLERLQHVIEELSKVSNKRKTALVDRLEYLQCIREAESLRAWIKEKSIPSSELDDYGKDVTTVQTLINKLNAYDSSVALVRSRLDAFTTFVSELCSKRNTRSNELKSTLEDVTSKWQHLLDTAATRREKLLKTQQTFKEIDSLYLEFAKKASQLNSLFENAEEDLTEPVRVNSLEEIEKLSQNHSKFVQSLRKVEDELSGLATLNQRIAAHTSAANPYTWFTVESLQSAWENLQTAIDERNKDLQTEMQRQKQNDDLRRQFAKLASEFNSWLSNIRAKMVEGTGSLEEQLERTKHYSEEVIQHRRKLKDIEDLGAGMEEKMILDNKYTEHSTVGLAQQWGQLEQLGMRMQHNLEQQIQAKNATGVSEEQLKEFSETFRYFDKDDSGFLEHREFKSCLRSLGYTKLEVVEDGESDPEFEAILATVDPNMDGRVSLSEFMAFMISRATENVESSNQVINAFRSAAGSKPYVMLSELAQFLSPDQIDYCKRHMQPYIDADGKEVPDALDYTQFTKNIFSS